VQICDRNQGACNTVSNPCTSGEIAAACAFNPHLAICPQQPPTLPPPVCNSIDLFCTPPGHNLVNPHNPSTNTLGPAPINNNPGSSQTPTPTPTSTPKSNLAVTSTPTPTSTPKSNLAITSAVHGSPSGGSGNTNTGGSIGTSSSSGTSPTSSGSTNNDKSGSGGGTPADLPIQNSTR